MRDRERRQLDEIDHACDDLIWLVRPLSNRHRRALSVSSRFYIIDEGVISSYSMRKIPLGSDGIDNVIS